jgi:acyl carrier protein
MNDTLSEVKDLIASTFSIPLESVADNSSGQTIEQWDSVGHINLVMAVEQKFGVSFTMDEIMHLRDVGAICRAVTEKAGKPTSA